MAQESSVNMQGMNVVVSYKKLLHTRQLLELNRQGSRLALQFLAEKGLDQEFQQYYCQRFEPINVDMMDGWDKPENANTQT